MKLFQINENDLGELEHTLPQLSEALMTVLNGRLRVQLRRVQNILSSVRWNYGPPDEAVVIPADANEDHCS